MRILSHYFITRYLSLFGLVLAVALLVLATIELVLNLDDVTAFGGGASGDSIASGSSGLPAIGHALRYLGIRLIAYYLADLLPIASFIAVFLAFAISGRAMELLAAQAGGIRPLRIIVPVLTTAGILSLGAALLHETVILPAEQAWSGGNPEDQESIDFGGEAFWFQRGPLITNAAYADPTTRELFDVEIFERSPLGSIVRVIRTDRVLITESGLWKIAAATVWRFDPRDPEVDPIVKRDVPLELDFEALRSGLLLGADPMLLPLPVLARYLEKISSENSATLRRVRSRYHERLASPWLVLLFAWLAMPFALYVDERGRIAAPAVAAVATIALFFVIGSAGQTLAQEEIIPIGWTPWFTMGFFALITGLGLRLRSR